MKSQVQYTCKLLVFNRNCSKDKYDHLQVKGALHTSLVSQYIPANSINVRPTENMQSQTQGTDRASIPWQVIQLAQMHSRVIKGAVLDYVRKKETINYTGKIQASQGI